MLPNYPTKKINVNCPGAVGNPIPLIGRFCPSCSGILAAPESDWNYTLEVDVKDLKNHKYKFVNGGDHDGMPSYEICMKDKPIYYRPAPGYSFNNFLSMFPPKEINFSGSGTMDLESGTP